MPGVVLGPGVEARGRDVDALVRGVAVEGADERSLDLGPADARVEA